MTDENTTLRRAFGLADAFELLATATPFPAMTWPTPWPTARWRMTPSAA